MGLDCRCKAYITVYMMHSLEVRNEQMFRTQLSSFPLDLQSSPCGSCPQPPLQKKKKHCIVCLVYSFVLEDCVLLETESDFLKEQMVLLQKHQLAGSGLHQHSSLSFVSVAVCAALTGYVRKGVFPLNRLGMTYVRSFGCLGPSKRGIGAFEHCPSCLQVRPHQCCVL